MDTQTAPGSVDAARIRRLVEQGKAHRPELARRLDRAAFIVLLRSVEPTDATAHEYAVESDVEPGRSYRVNGTCECPDYARAPGHWCKHRLAVALVERAADDAARERASLAAIVKAWEELTA